jgi:hypothetical protein
MNRATMLHLWKFFSSAALIGVAFIVVTLSRAQAAQLVMFEQAGCAWCETFDRQVAPSYAKSEEGLRAPLRRVDISEPLPPDLSFIQVERFTPVFVLVDKGREIGRIRGYPGAESFWMQIDMLFDRLQRLESVGGERVQLPDKTLRTTDRSSLALGALIGPMVDAWIYTVRIAAGT